MSASEYKTMVGIKVKLGISGLVNIQFMYPLCNKA